ncbi:MAG TPA: PilN domain-containing protein [Anaerohalosphaeraceae bacterium]|mgnify:CR=1 FL=1|nr:PilN domain-containing protein [Anaerohalosphaeraceae bacterium]HOL88442.1 PilN domain-containing protein [Anaerohalosphaeraceae bacterium]HPP56981.1 PilN domain-containing protein [Anaerohalosphaeraceae bacterium]
MRVQRKKESLGIVLTDSYAEAVWVEAVGPKVVRLRSGRTDLPAGEVCGGWIERPARTAGLIRKMLKTARIGLRRAVVVVPDAQTAAQILDLPAEIPSNMQKFIHTEMRFSPILVKRTAYADYRSLGADEEGKERILAGLTTRECIRNLTETFRLAGVEIQSLQMDFCAVYRAIEAFWEEARKTKNLLTASLTGRTLTVCAYLNRKLDFVQRFSWEGRLEELSSFILEQVRTIQQFYELEKGFSFQHHWQVMVVLEDSWKEALEGLQSGLESLFGDRVVLITPERRPEGLGLKGNEPVWPAALGAAWKGIEPAAHSVPELLPPEVLEQYAWQRSFWKTVAAAALMLGGFAVSAWLMPFNAQALSDSEKPPSLIQTAERHKQLKEKIDILRDLQRVSEEMNRQRAVFSFSSVFEEIRKAIPPALQITSLEMNRNGMMEISGRALSIQAIYQFAARLGQSSLISNAAVAESRLSAGSGRVYEYRIICRLKSFETGEEYDADAVSD